MAAEVISITRALAEVKALEGRIQTAIAEARFVAVAKGQGSSATTINSNLTPYDAAARIKSQFQAITDMIDRRKRIKANIIAANAVTTIVIAGEPMTVAEAIERKNAIKIEHGLLLAMRQQFTGAVTACQKDNAALDAEIEKAVQAAYGGANAQKPTPEMYAAIANPRKAALERSVIDPLELGTSRITSMEGAITGFMTEVDFVLSESNAKTTIAV